MVRKCTEKDRERLHDYLKQEAEYNTYILADIDDYGFESEAQTVYVDEEGNEIKGVYLCFYQNFLLYSADNTVNAQFLSDLFEDYRPDVVLGKLECVNEVAKLLPTYTVRSQNLYFLDTPDHLETDESGIQKAQLEEAGEIFDFIQTIPEIKNLYTSKQMIVDRIEKNLGTHYLVRKDGQLIAQANSAAACDYTTMIGGVATNENFRGEKIASRIVSRLCRDIRAIGKRPCLFAADRDEHNFYTRIGFTKAGKWGIMVKG